MQNQASERAVTDFVENYMEKLFYFCLKKTGNSTEAEDLTQEIALHIITALQSGKQPTNFSAWVWQIARNRYARWAEEKHRRAETMTGVDIGEYELEDENADVVAQTVKQEQLALLRRELAFVRSEYRDIVVAYYLENRSVRDIADALNLSVAAVQQRLHRARNLLKEGMDMAREFGVRSYRPEQVSFVQNGRDGKNGQPWSIITHLLYKNIFLETYENPQTAEQLALELGIALPYMEDELEFLVREQLLRKEGNKYQTDFPIVSREAQRAVHDANRAVQKPLTDKMCEMIDLYMKEDGAKVNISYVGYENAKWALLVRLFDWMQWAYAKSRGEEEKSPYPQRPDDGAWTLTGYQTIDWAEPYFVGLHGWQSHDVKSPRIMVEFGQFKFNYKTIGQLTPEHISYQEAYNLWLVCSGKSEECERGYVDKLLEYGYLKTVDGVLTPNVLILDRDAKARGTAETTEKLSALKQEIFELFAKAPAIKRGYVVEQALSDGWLKYDENTDKTVGAYIYI